VPPVEAPRPITTLFRAGEGPRSPGAAAATAFAAATVAPPTPYLWQCLGLLLLIPVTHLISRYFLLQYLYRLRSYEDGRVDFEVYAYRRGNRMQLVCRVALSEIVAVTSHGAKGADAATDAKRFSYLPDISPAGAVVLSVQNADGASEVAILPDEGMRRLLEEAVARNTTQ